ncbi:MAG TPA: geranylgeranyl reductase family protein, partial [Candidatus Cloacimonadota bacterium]|nr:geranylgeranyl reductase family protein [Candidatus Cloacimonadota bacterium]
PQICDLCGACVGVCPSDALILHEQAIEFISEKCIVCHHCEQTCPVHAIILDSSEPANPFMSSEAKYAEESLPPVTCVIIGAGPAGLTTALYAAQNGVDVLLLERDEQVGIPVRCAEGVFQSNLKDIIAIPDEMKCAEVKGVNIFAPDGTKIEMLSPETGFILDRVKFETYLAEIVVEAGAELLTNADVIDVKRISPEELEVHFLHQQILKSVRCRIIVGADGVESRIGKLMGLDTSVSLTDMDSCAQYLLEDIDINQDRCEIHFGNEVAPGGYAWVFPKSDRSANVGVGICAARKNVKTARDYLEDFVARCYPSGRITAFIAGGVPVAKSLSSLVNDNVLLVGDAARQTNPLTGGGIEYSMQAGKMAGNAIAAAMQNGDFNRESLLSYQKAWETRFKKIQDIAYVLKSKLYSATDIRMNELFGDLAQVPIPKLSARALFMTVLKNHPILLAKMARSYFMDLIH